jgi:hypothetical protein
MARCQCLEVVLMAFKRREIHVILCTHFTAFGRLLDSSLFSRTRRVCARFLQTANSTQTRRPPSSFYGTSVVEITSYYPFWILIECARNKYNPQSYRAFRKPYSQPLSPILLSTMSFLLSPTRRAGFAGSALASRTFSTTRPSQLARMTLVGRLGTDPELVDAGKTQLVRYVVGSSSGPKDNKQTSWFRVASFAPEGPQRDYILGLSKG